MSKSLELALCDTQGQLFELSGDRGISSEAFIKAFMTSDISKDMDSEFNHVQWAGKEYIYSRMEDECKDALAAPGEVFDKETLYWTGYIYRYWNLYTGESSKEIYRQAPAKTMQVVYLMYHTMSPEMAIDRLKEVYNAKNEEAVKKFDKAKKIKDAEGAIGQINDILSDSSLFRRKADSLYDEIIKNIDYAPFIVTAKAASGMGGKIPFKQLPYLPKRNALIMIRDAIKAYIVAEIAKKEN